MYNLLHSCQVSGLLKCPVCEIFKMETILYNKSNLAFEMIGIASYECSAQCIRSIVSSVRFTKVSALSVFHLQSIVT